jgi:hypothetical protein
MFSLRLLINPEVLTNFSDTHLLKSNLLAMSIPVEDIQRHSKNGLFRQNVYRQKEITGNMLNPRQMLTEYSPRFIFVRLINRKTTKKN